MLGRRGAWRIERSSWRYLLAWVGCEGGGYGSASADHCADAEGQENASVGAGVGASVNGSASAS